MEMLSRRRLEKVPKSMFDIFQSNFRKCHVYAASYILINNARKPQSCSEVGALKDGVAPGGSSSRGNIDGTLASPYSCASVRVRVCTQRRTECALKFIL